MMKPSDKEVADIKRKARAFIMEQDWPLDSICCVKSAYYRVDKAPPFDFGFIIRGKLSSVYPRQTAKGENPQPIHYESVDDLLNYWDVD